MLQEDGIFLGAELGGIDNGILLASRDSENRIGLVIRQDSPILEPALELIAVFGTGIEDKIAELVAFAGAVVPLVARSVGIGPIGRKIGGAVEFVLHADEAAGVAVGIDSKEDGVGRKDGIVAEGVFVVVGIFGYITIVFIEGELIDRVGGDIGDEVLASVNGLHGVGPRDEMTVLGYVAGADTDVISEIEGRIAVGLPVEGVVGEGADDVGIDAIDDSSGIIIKQGNAGRLLGIDGIAEMPFDEVIADTGRGAEEAVVIAEVVAVLDIDTCQVEEREDGSRAIAVVLLVLVEDTILSGVGGKGSDERRVGSEVDCPARLVATIRPTGKMEAGRRDSRDVVGCIGDRGEADAVGDVGSDPYQSFGRVSTIDFEFVLGRGGRDKGEEEEKGEDISLEDCHRGREDRIYRFYGLHRHYTKVNSTDCLHIKLARGEVDT